MKIKSRFLFLLLPVILLAISATCPGKVDTPQLILPNKKSLNIVLAITMEDQMRGLSGIREGHFPSNKAMLFAYFEPGDRRFWMPDTYFDLDIFFLDENLKVIDVERNVRHHPGVNQPPPIAVTRNIYCHHVLEIASASPLAKDIQIGMKLEWKSKDTNSLKDYLSRIKQDIRQKQ